MSDTPRTDAVCRTVDHTTIMGGKIYQATIETVNASLARRQLEKELAEARAEIERRNNWYNLLFNTFSQLREEHEVLKEGLAERDKLVEQMREALQYADDIVEGLDVCDPIRREKEYQIVFKALSAAERIKL